MSSLPKGLASFASQAIKLGGEVHFHGNGKDWSVYQTGDVPFDTDAVSFLENLCVANQLRRCRFQMATITNVDENKAAYRDSKGRLQQCITFSTESGFLTIRWNTAGWTSECELLG